MRQRFQSWKKNINAYMVVQYSFVGSVGFRILIERVSGFDEGFILWGKEREPFGAVRQIVCECNIYVAS